MEYAPGHFWVEINRLSRQKQGRGKDAVPEGLRRKNSGQRSRPPTAEIHIRVALINRFNALGTADVVRLA